MTKILVTGATGNVGSSLVRELKARGESVRAFVRDADRAAGKLGDGVGIVPGDFADAASVRRAVEDVDLVFLACANHPRQAEYEMGVIDAAVAAGMRRVVKLSAFGAEVGSPVAFWDWHARIEAHLIASGVPATILRPHFMMTNLLGAAEQVRYENAMFAPAGGARISMIDPRDVAAAAAVSLTAEGHEGQTYVLTGPEPITHDHIAGELSAAVGRRIQYFAVPDEAARQSLIATGMPELVAGQIVTVYGILRQGAQEQITASVHTLTGREPRTFARFAHDHAGLFTPGEDRAGVPVGSGS